MLGIVPASAVEDLRLIDEFALALIAMLAGGELRIEETGSKGALAPFIFAYLVVVIAHRLHVELLLVGVSAGFVIESLSPAGDHMIQGIESVSVVIFAFFFAIAGASLDLGAIPDFWLPAIGDGVVALGMTVIIANFLGGSIVLKRALQSGSGE